MGRIDLSPGLCAWLRLFAVRPILDDKQNEGKRIVFDRTKARITEPIKQATTLAVVALFVAVTALILSLSGLGRSSVNAV